MYVWAEHLLVGSPVLAVRKQNGKCFAALDEFFDKKLNSSSRLRIMPLLKQAVVGEQGKDGKTALGSRIATGAARTSPHTQSYTSPVCPGLGHTITPSTAMLCQTTIKCAISLGSCWR